MEWVLVTAVKTELALVVQAVHVQWRIATVAQMEPVPVVQDVIATMHGQCQCGPDGCNCAGSGMQGTCASCGGHSYGMHGMIGHGMNAVSGTIQSDTDPGKGHDQHQLAVLLAPRDRSYTGLLTYSASENVQLVALHGPLPEGKVKGQTIWTPDGKTKFG
jgi:hypothetical protein